MASPLTGDSADMVDAAISPRTISEKYSAEVKLKATFTMTGENSIIRTMPTLAPKKEATVVMNSAIPARPCRAMG